jgi:hypothetical protein
MRFHETVCLWLQGFYFLGYEWTKHVLNPDPTHPAPTSVLLAAGAVAGVLGVRTAAVAFPVQVPIFGWSYCMFSCAVGLDVPV